MLKSEGIHRLEEIEFRVVYSRRRTLGISVLPDSSVVVRVPLRTSDKTINRIVTEKASWIIRHRDSYRNNTVGRQKREFADGGKHLFRGTEYVLAVRNSKKSFVRLNDNKLEIGLENSDPEQIKKMLYKWYKAEASALFQELLKNAILKYDTEQFKPSQLVIRSMKRRWGSCSGKGKITLSTELVKLPDKYIIYVITHELCHLKHHNHGSGFYQLLSVLYPDWKIARKEMRNLQAL